MTKANEKTLLRIAYSAFKRGDRNAFAFAEHCWRRHRPESPDLATIFGALSEALA
jgi:hypothetical protein